MQAQVTPTNDYCFTPPPGPTTCYPTGAQAEAAMRASTPTGPYLRKDKEAPTGNPQWLRQFYVAEPQKPAQSPPGYTVGGWSASDLGCTSIAFVDGNGSGHCASEAEAVNLWVSRRATFLASYSCQYLRNTLTGSQTTPNAIYGAQTGMAYFTLGHNSGRYIDEQWWCPGWGSPEPAIHPTSVSKLIPLTCPTGFSLGPGTGVWEKVCVSLAAPYIDVRLRQGEGCAASANPCYPGTGEKRRHEVDFEFAGEPFQRTYRSLGQIRQGQIGAHWNRSHGSRIANPTTAPVLVDDDGSMLPFTYVGNAGGIYYYRVRGLSDRAARSGNGVYEVVGLDGHTRTYDSTTGRLIRRQHSSDPARNLEYVYGADGLLTEVVDALQRKLTFHYAGLEVQIPGGSATATYQTRVLIGIVLPDSGSVEYTYDDAGNLTQVRRPGGSMRDYHYNETAHVVVPSPHLMTGISDDGVRYATFTYDQHGRVTSSALAGNAERTELSYIATNQVDVRTSNGLVRRYAFDDSLERRILSITDAAGAIENVYDGDRLRTESRDRLGRRTTYTYAGGFVATLTEATGTAEARTRSYARDAMGRVLGEMVTTAGGTPVIVAQTKLTRDPDGRVSAACQYDPASPNTTYACGSAADAPTGVRQKTFAYCNAIDAAATNSNCPVLGLLKSVDGPLSGRSDTTTYAYRPTDDLSGCATTGSCHRKGDLHVVTSAAGHTTTFARYDATGRPTRILDANGVATDLEYNARGWLTARKIRGADNGTEADDAITRLAYDNVGQVTRLTQPDGAFVEFTYDPARRLTGITDALGNTLRYTLDGAGNRVAEETRDAGNVLRRSLLRVYDQLGQLETLADALATPTDFTYDAQGNLDTVTNVLGRVSDHDYDALGRLRQSIANVAGAGPERAITRFGYDARDNLTAVIDPKGLTTAYAYNGLNDLVRLASPDTGTTTYGYDSAGNRIRQLDARGIQTFYRYDVLNRLTGIDLPTPGQAIGFAYDAVPAECPAAASFGAGRLAQITDASGHTRYCHDRRGNVVRKVQTVTGGPTRTVAYTHNAADRLVAMTYPSGAVVRYQRDAAGRITGLTTQPTATAAEVPVVAHATYLPFGPLSQLRFGNGRVLTKAYDQNYGIASVADATPGGLSLDYRLNDVGHVVGLNETLAGGTAAARSLEYDGLDRLSALKNGAGTVQGFAYDPTGNRIRKVTSGTSNYTYALDSHRLTKVGSVNRRYDAAGNTLATTATRSFTYDDRGRMVQYLASGVVSRTYQHNGRGERVAKRIVSTPANNVYYVYDEAGRLLGEYRASGARIKEYVWLDDTLVAVLASHASSNHQYVLTDHLGTPRAVVHPARNAIVWRWDLTPTAFGEHAAQNNPDGDSATYTFNLRYPGQYFDSETGLHYNYFRDYDPSTGRYVQSDPIGLAAGVNTYAYVDSSPLLYSDPLGLTKWELEFHLAQYQPAINVEGPFGIKIKVKGPKLFNFGVTGYSPCVNGRRTTVSLDAKFKGDYDASSPLPLSLAMGSATLDDGLPTINTEQFVGPTSVSSDVRWNTSATGSWTIAGKTVPLNGNGISGDFEVAATLSPTKWHGWEEDCTCE